MSRERTELDLIDLISERHQTLRKLLQDKWNERSNIYLSNSEWFILARIYQQGTTTISDISKIVDISRQATHKFIRQLADKNLVEIQSLENNKKKKAICLTELGKECYEKNVGMKIELEGKIANQIGKEKVHVLKEILQLDWGL